MSRLSFLRTIRLLSFEVRPIAQFNFKYGSAQFSNTKSVFFLPSTKIFNGNMFSHGNDSQNPNRPLMDLNLYERLSEQLLDNLAETFDELLETNYPDEFDVSLANGVLTIKLSKHGTYVLNKQTPNRQIWLSSPTSGPKRYDYIDNQWIYLHDGNSLPNILSQEFSQILNQPVSISKS